MKVKHLTKQYSQISVVEDLSFSIQKGEIFGLLGANGAGKSTTIECILGTKKMTTGEVTLLGLDPTQDRKRLFEKVGVQFQEANYPEKIRVGELCEETASLYRETADYQDLLQKFGLSEKQNSPISVLSGGQKQKLFIIQALIPNPEFIFLDELTTGLDPRARREVWELLTMQKERGITILLTSHFMDEVEKLCDTILILKKGKTVFKGSVKEAIASSPYQNLEEAYLWYTEEGKDESIL